MAAIASVAVMLTGVVATAPAGAAVATLTESFTDATMVSPGDWYMSYTGQKPCLTAAAATQSVTLSNTTLPGCGGTVDPAGQGALLLSRNTADNAVTMLYNKELSTAAGLDVQFFEAQYGHSSDWGADGLTFFTKLGSVSDLGVGEYGGGLGYVGVKGGLFAVGFDAWLNWTRTSSGTAEQTGGMRCPAGTENSPGTLFSVAIRGADISAAKDGSSGYCLLDQQAIGQQYFGLKTDTRATMARPVRVIVDPSTVPTPQIHLYMWRTGGLGQDPATADIKMDVNQPAEYKTAGSFKFGFTASTGAFMNYHAIWGLGIAAKDAAVATTYYAVPQSQTIQKGATPTYSLKYYKDAAHTQEFTPGGLTSPTCTSPYVPASSAAGTYTITCTGGAISLANLQIDGTGTLTVTQPAATLSPAVQTVTWYKGEPIPALAAWVTSNFNGPLSWTSTAVPLRIGISGVTGVISGTPDAVGSGSITVSVTDQPVNLPGAPPPSYTPQTAQAVINYTIVERTSWNYTVNYDANGGTGTMAAQTGSGSSVTLANNAFTRTGFTFTGWQSDVGTAYTNGQTVPMTGALTLNLKAQWKAEPTLTPATQTITGKVNTAVATTAFTTSGFTGAVRYSIAPALPGALTINATTGVVTGTPTAVLQSTTFTVTATDGTDTKTATINLTIGGQTDWTYLVEYSANGGTGTMARQTGTAPSVTLTKNTFTRAGYTFNGWKDKYAGGTFTDGQVVQLTKSGDFLMEAQWKAEPKITPETQVISGVAGQALASSRAYAAVNFSGPVTYTITPALPAGVTIDANTGVISGTPTAPMTTVNYVVKAVSGAESATAAVDLFVTAADSNTNGGGTGGNGGAGGGGTNAYAISFDPNGGEGVMAGLTGSGATSVTLTKNAFTSRTMSWVGWRDDKGVTYTDGQVITFSGNLSLVLHAQWRFNESSIGSFTKPAPVRVGATQPVSFAKNSNALSAISNTVLRKWDLRTVAAITIAGFVEPAGSSANDFPLSLNRAKAVAQVMAKKYKGLRIKTVGMGRQIAKKCRPFKNKCAYITIMVMKTGTVKKTG